MQLAPDHPPRKGQNQNLNPSKLAQGPKLLTVTLQHFFKQHGSHVLYAFYVLGKQQTLIYIHVFHKQILTNPSR